MNKIVITLCILFFLFVPLPYYQNNDNVVCKQGEGCHGNSKWKFGYPLVVYLYVIGQKSEYAVRDFICEIKYCPKAEIDPGFGIMPRSNFNK